MYSVMIDFRYLVTPARGDRRMRLTHRLRNPPRFWRSVALGAFLAMPGAVAGLLLALLLPLSCAIPAAVAGVAAGFAGGFLMERR